MSLDGGGDARQELQIVGNAELEQIASAVQGTLSVSVSTLPLPAGGATAVNQATEIALLASLNSEITTGTLDVAAAALPLPAGASTEATLALIKARTDNLDVALSTRAVTGLTDTQLRASPVPVSGTVTATGPLTDAQMRAAPVSVTEAGSATSAAQATGNASLSNIDGKTPNLVSGRQPVDGSGVTQPISAVSLPLPSNAATAALQTQPGVDIGDVTVNNAAGGSAVNIQDGGNSITIDGTVGISGSVAVTGPLTDAQLRALAVPVSVASLPLPALAATEATLATRLAEATYTTRQPVQGQAAMAASVPVVIASNQTAISVTRTSSADVLALNGDAAYAAGQTNKNLTQSPDGRLNVVAAGMVGDTRPSLSDGALSLLSMTSEGRLRVATEPARYGVPFFEARQDKMWEQLESDCSFDGNPWGAW